MAAGTWFKNSDKPDEVDLGCCVTAEFDDDTNYILLTAPHSDQHIYLDHESVKILSCALQEWKEKNG